MSSIPSAAKNEKSTPSLLKKRTADQAGLDHAIADALGKKKTGDMQSGDGKGTSTTPDPAGKSSGEEGKEVNAKDWLMDQVAKMESAFKDACYYRALIIRFHVEARYHNLHYVQPQAPRFMVNKYRDACLTWESTKSTVQAYLEEAAKHYVPPVAPIDKPITASAPAPTTSSIPLSTTETSQPPTSTVKFDASLPYIDPRTGLPSPTQPTIKIHDDNITIRSAPAVTAKGTQNGKLPSVATNKKNSASGALDSGRKKAARTPTASEQNISANSSINAKFPTGSAGDPIEIDDLDIDMDNDADIVPLIRPPPNAGKEQPGKQTAQQSGAMQTVTQPEGIGLGLGLGEINVDLPATQPAASDSLLNPPTEDVAGDVSALLANIQNAVAATAGEAQLSEEDIMKFFETLAPGAGDGGEGQGENVAAMLAGNDGQFTAAGLGMTDQFAGNVQDPAAGLGQPFINPTGDITADVTNALGTFDASGEGAAVPVEVENAMPEDLDLSNMDWTQYSALLADIPDENGA